MLFAKTTVEFVCEWQATIDRGDGRGDADADADAGGGSGGGDGSGISASPPTTAHALHFNRLLVHVNRTPNLSKEQRDIIHRCLRRAVSAKNIAAC